MAWFIGQSAVMIVLAFLLGLLVGWIIWGRRARALHIEVLALRAFANACETHHGGFPQDMAAPSDGASTADAAAETHDAAAETHDAAAETRVSAVRIPAPRAEMDDRATDVVTTPADPTAVADEAAPADNAADDTARADDTALGDHTARADTTTPIDDATPADTTTPTSDTAPADSIAPVDDLVRVEGIGPKIAAALVTARIRTFRQLADADEGTLRVAIKAAGITFAPSIHSWSAQARLLADGDEAGFLELTERLIAGRAAKTTEGVAETPDTPPDDLARIEGIGPKIAAALVAGGIRTFHQMAAADEATLTDAVRAAGITFTPSLYTWADQARLLADGDEDGFAVLTARLIAGRRPDDDLERVEGIGPQMAAALHAAGIRTYRALADSSDVKLRNAISGSGLSFAPSIVTWSRQARLLADGDEDGFSDLTRRLVAGRDEGRA